MSQTWARRKGIQVPRILVADDNTNIQKMVALAFEERGIEVVSVGNGEAAVRRIPDLSPDLVLADVFMPVRNGYEVCEFIKKDDRFSHVPVILLVGAFDPLDEKEARRVGADGVLKKPFVPPDPLIAMVTSALEKNPKIAAEMAKAKEVIPEPPPLPVLENPVKMEPKPLPEFPEPTPEEAAVIYGFGKGVRNLDDAESKADESSAPKSPEVETDVEPEEEFDGASTTRDWRRSEAMNFEVPEEPGGKLAFASDADFSPSSFPPEQDVPPRQVHTPVPSEEEIAVEPTATPAETETESEEPSIRIVPRTANAEAEPEFKEKLGSTPEESPAAAETVKAPGWMDMMAPLPAEYPDGGWMSDVVQIQAETGAAQTPAQPATPSAPLEVFDGAKNATNDKPFFADEPDASEPWLAPLPPAKENVPEPASMNTAGATIDLEDQLAPAPAILGNFSHKDPQLEEPPAPHVTPEPLFSHDEPQEPLNCAKLTQETTPLHSFFAPASGDPVVDEPVVEEPPAQTESAPPEAASTQSPFDEFDERIPTMLPPNREALAGIPFLTPPPLPVIEPGKTAENGVDSRTVDAVVEKVLEKLEPQLHELLSQGLLKPLVESLLQKEAAKKEK